MAAVGSREFLRREGLPPLPEALRVRGPVSERIRAKGVIAARESLRRRMEEADVEASPIALRLLGEGRSRVGIARDLNKRSGLAGENGSALARHYRSRVAPASRRASSGTGASLRLYRR